MQSSDVVVQAPMSYSGSRRRLWRPVSRASGVAAVLLGVVMVVVIALAWTAVTAWYLVFGLLLAPYRLIRRGSRKRKRDELRHQELLDAARGGRVETPRGS